MTRVYRGREGWTQPLKGEKQLRCPPLLLLNAECLIRKDHQTQRPNKTNFPLNFLNYYYLESLGMD